jgi:hypothetical protein
VDDAYYERLAAEANERADKYGTTPHGALPDDERYERLATTRSAAELADNALHNYERSATKWLRLVFLAATPIGHVLVALAVIAKLLVYLSERGQQQPGRHTARAYPDFHGEGTSPRALHLGSTESAARGLAP